MLWGDLMGTTITLQKGNDVLLDLEVKEASKATFSLSYLSEIIKAASATSDIATLEFSTDMPVLIDFQQAKGEKLTFFLAPRIERNNEYEGMIQLATMSDELIQNGILWISNKP